MDAEIKRLISEILNENKHGAYKNKKFYFVSDNDNLKKIYPRVPKNFFTKNGYEDATTKRVCLSKSINGSLSALSQNLERKNFNCI